MGWVKLQGSRVYGACSLAYLIGLSGQGHHAMCCKVRGTLTTAMKAFTNVGRELCRSRLIFMVSELFSQNGFVFIHVSIIMTATPVAQQLQPKTRKSNYTWSFRDKMCPTNLDWNKLQSRCWKTWIAGHLCRPSLWWSLPCSLLRYMIQPKDLIESSIPLGFPTPKYFGPIGAQIMTLNNRHPTFHPGCQA